MDYPFIQFVLVEKMVWGDYYIIMIIIRRRHTIPFELYTDCGGSLMRFEVNNIQ